MTVFGKMYADVYDTIYNTKNYNQEVDFLEEIFKKFGKSPVHTVLDLGCGTGGHSLVLDQRGYQVCGVDLSQEMLDLARRKASALNRGGEWVQGDIRTFKIGKLFDAAVMMFAVLSYQTTMKYALALTMLRPSGAGRVVYGGFLVGRLYWRRVHQMGRNGTRTASAFYFSSQAEFLSANLRVQVPRARMEAPTSGRTIEVHEMRYLFPHEWAISLTRRFKVRHWSIP